ncbi:UNVERIFIED_CONTAM: hypothetical protein GTU68_022340 [Idotea baltica]|nr:hypothetical protein [Idotea baltica]
MVLIFFMPI